LAERGSEYGSGVEVRAAERGSESDREEVRAAEKGSESGRVWK